MKQYAVVYVGAAFVGTYCAVVSRVDATVVVVAQKGAAKVDEKVDTVA